MDNFEITSINEDGISINLSFPDPYIVSAGDKPDMLLL